MKLERNRGREREWKRDGDLGINGYVEPAIEKEKEREMEGQGTEEDERRGKRYENNSKI